MAHRNNRSLLQTIIPPRPKLYEKNMENGYANNKNVDNTAQISENFNEFLGALIKSLQINSFIT